MQYSFISFTFQLSERTIIINLKQRIHFHFIARAFNLQQQSKHNKSMSEQQDFQVIVDQHQFKKIKHLLKQANIMNINMAKQLKKLGQQNAQLNKSQFKQQKSLHQKQSHILSLSKEIFKLSQLTLQIDNERIKLKQSSLNKESEITLKYKEVLYEKINLTSEFQKSIIQLKNQKKGQFQNKIQDFKREISEQKKEIQNLRNANVIYLEKLKQSRGFQITFNEPLQMKSDQLKQAIRQKELLQISFDEERKNLLNDIKIKNEQITSCEKRLALKTQQEVKITSSLDMHRKQLNQQANILIDKAKQLNQLRTQNQTHKKLIKTLDQQKKVGQKNLSELELRQKVKQDQILLAQYETLKEKLQQYKKSMIEQGESRKYLEKQNRKLKQKLCKLQTKLVQINNSNSVYSNKQDQKQEIVVQQLKNEKNSEYQYQSKYRQRQNSSANTFLSQIRELHDKNNKLHAEMTLHKKKAEIQTKKSLQLEKKLLKQQEMKNQIDFYRVLTQKRNIMKQANLPIKQIDEYMEQTVKQYKKAMKTILKQMKQKKGNYKQLKMSK